MKKNTKSDNNRQKRNPDESLEDWYLHPRKGWKRERPRQRAINAANRERWRLFKTTTKPKENTDALHS